MTVAKKSAKKSTAVSRTSGSTARSSTASGNATSSASTPSTDRTGDGLTNAKSELSLSDKKKQIIEKARLAAEKAEKDAADIEGARRERLSRFIKNIRGVSPENPDGRMSQRQLAQEMGIGFASIRNYEAKENSPQRIKHSTLDAIARFGGCSTEELRGYVMHGEYKPKISKEDVAAFLRWSSLDEILFVLQAASSAAQQKINEVSKAQ